MTSEPVSQLCRLTDADADLEASISAGDIGSAAAAARRYGTPLFNALLDATLMDDSAKPLADRRDAWFK